VANFPTSAITLQVGQVLGTAARQQIHNHAKLIQTLAEVQIPKLGLGSQADTNTVTSQAKDLFNSEKLRLSDKDPPSEAPLEGGPKTSEAPIDSTDSSRLLEEFDINPELSLEQRAQIEGIILRSQRAFGSDDRLGHLNS
jgi:hypothetical protein